MKKSKNAPDQLDIFQSREIPKKEEPSQQKEETFRGKQVFLDNRSAIYEKILNRKME